MAPLRRRSPRRRSRPASTAVAATVRAAAPSSQPTSKPTIRSEDHPVHCRCRGEWLSDRACVSLDCGCGSRKLLGLPVNSAIARFDSIRCVPTKASGTGPLVVCASMPRADRRQGSASSASRFLRGAGSSKAAIVAREKDLETTAACRGGLPSPPDERILGQGAGALNAGMVLRARKAEASPIGDERWSSRSEAPRRWEIASPPWSHGRRRGRWTMPRRDRPPCPGSSAARRGIA